MFDDYQDYEINIEDFCFPKSIIKANVNISTIKNRNELKTVFRAYQEIFPDEIDTSKGEQLEQITFTSSNYSYIAKIEDKIVGFIITAPITQKCILLAYLGILKDYRGKGVATKLLETLIQYLKEQEYEKICCTIHSQNKKTLNYIKVLGFHKLIKDKEQ